MIYVDPPGSTSLRVRSLRINRPAAPRMTHALGPPRPPRPYYPISLPAGDERRHLFPISGERLRRGETPSPLALVVMVNPTAAAAAARGGGDESKKRKKAIGGRWPLVKHKKDLQIDRLKGDHLFTVPNFLNSSEAKTFIEVAESLGFTHQGSLGPAKGEAFRDNERISVSDPDLAESIWESGLKRIFNDIKLPGKVAVGLNPNIRFYRYDVGQRFGRHIDESVDIGQGRKTQYTLLIYLSGSGSKSTSVNQHLLTQPLGGGETVFYDQRRIVAEVAPLEGMALLHIHGSKCMLHEARTVTKGAKYILRSDVVFA